jgi:hypothetical protein
MILFIIIHYIETKNLKKPKTLNLVEIKILCILYVTQKLNIIIKIKMNYNIDYIIKILLKNNIATYKLDKIRKEPIKIRYEYKSNNKINNIFLYFFKWNDFICLYDKIPKDKRHFYEIINEKCKFFLDLDGKMDQLEKNKWDIYVDDIKNKIVTIIYDLTEIKCNIIEYESLPFINENKYSSHLIINEFNLKIEQCKEICEIIMNKLDVEISKIIDNNIYNKWRSLRMEGCTKMGSERIKFLKSKNNIIYTNYLNFDGFVTKLNNTISLDTFYIFSKKYYISDAIFNNHINIEYINLNKNIKEHKINNNDIIFIKTNFKKLEFFINKWHNVSNNFYTYKINNNIVMYIKKLPYICNVCDRTHDNQNPYIYVRFSEIYFDCRRSNSKGIKVTDIFKNFVKMNY